MELKIKTQCPHCEAVYKVPDVYQGKLINCPKCKESFTIQKYEGANKTQQEPQAYFFNLVREISHDSVFMV